MTHPETEKKPWQLWSQENFALVTRARQDFFSLRQQEQARVFSNMLSNILLGLTVLEIMVVLESLGVGSYTASQFQGKVSAGAFFPEIHAWSYYFQYHMVRSSSGELQPSAELTSVVSSILSYDFSQHPFWKDRVLSSSK